MEQADILEPKWYVIHTKSRHEFQVNERLAMKGIEAFLPTVERLRAWKDRKKMVAFPLFPGYLFVRMLKKPQDLLSVLKIGGVVRFLSSVRGEPDSVPDEQMDFLKKLVENKEALDPYPYLSEGQRVRIKTGSLRGIEGILVEKVGKHMLVLSVDVLRQGVALTINAAFVEKI